MLTSEDLLKHELPEDLKNIIQPCLKGVYDEDANQIGTAFLSVWKAKPILITAKHCLVGHDGDEDPDKKRLHLEGDLTKIGDLRISEIEYDHEGDVAVAALGLSEQVPLIPYTSLDFNKDDAVICSIIGFLSRDFKRDRALGELQVKPFAYTHKVRQCGPDIVSVEYLNRAISAKTGNRDLAPIPKGLSGTVMVNAAELLLNKVKVIGVFTDAPLAEGHVFGTHMSKVEPLLNDLQWHID